MLGGDILAVDLNDLYNAITDVNTKVQEMNASCTPNVSND